MAKHSFLALVNFKHIAHRIIPIYLLVNLNHILQNLYIKSHEIIRYNQITFVQHDKNYKLLSIPPKCKI